MKSLFSFFFLFTLMLSSSCTHSVSLIGTGCHSAGQWGTEQTGETMEPLYQKKLWTYPGKTEIRLDDLLEEVDLNCQTLESLEAIMVTDFWDGFLSLLPGFKRQTLIIKGIAFSLKEEDTPGIGP